jgi:hypothetical protein
MGIIYIVVTVACCQHIALLIEYGDLAGAGAYINT